MDIQNTYQHIDIALVHITANDQSFITSDIVCSR